MFIQLGNVLCLGGKIIRNTYLLAPAIRKSLQHALVGGTRYLWRGSLMEGRERESRNLLTG